MRSGRKKLRFVQLYTSKSFENRRSELLNPEEDENDTRENESLRKHTLSPQLVDAISQTAQVVWANTRKQEGLTGRSNLRLQTAVGMPVAIDANGNMCVVVMFSPNNVQSSDDALEYLQSISQSATSSSIPCLLPVFDAGSGMKQLPALPAPSPDQPSEAHHTDSLGEGITTRFVSLDDHHNHDRSTSPSMDVEVHNVHELTSAPKDTFGIPMLPGLDDIGLDEAADAFDEATYGIWATIMDPNSVEDFQTTELSWADSGQDSTCSLSAPTTNRVQLPELRRERLEEFCHAFIGMSVFDLADVWVPAGDSYPDLLQHVMSVANIINNDSIRNFFQSSERTLVQSWSGAIGRAYASGNPVWSTSSSVFTDPGREAAFTSTNIRSVLAVPVFSAKSSTPSCVVGFYSLVEAGSVPFVLRFVQQALRLLWDGLDQVQPHESVGETIWKGVAPADLGEMAADVEMQSHFIRKRTFSQSFAPLSRSGSLRRGEHQAVVFEDEETATNLETVTLPNGETITVPLHLDESKASLAAEVHIQEVQNHLYEAVRSMQDARPFEHVTTNSQGTKRAHIARPPFKQSSPLPAPKPLPNQIVGQNTVQSVVSGHPTQRFPGDKNTALTDSSFNGLSNQIFPNMVTSSSTQSMSSYNSVSSTNSSDNQYCVPIEGSYVRKFCRIDGCNEDALIRRPYCVNHSGNRMCEHSGCGKCAQGSTRFCIAHGGGRRCTFAGCDKGARDKFFCAAHGGGKRCRTDGCNKSAVGGSSFCTAHGGGRRCAVEGCDKSAQSSTKFCVKHGGGKKCSHEGCEKVARGRTQFCAAHGGGIRCRLEGCNRVAIGKMQLCRAHGGFSTRSRKARPPSSNGSHSPSEPNVPEMSIASDVQSGITNPFPSPCVVGSHRSDVHNE